MNFLVSILYYFRQGMKVFGKGGIENSLAGNLDPFYMISPLYFYENYKNKDKMKKLAIIILPIILLAVIQYIFNEEINILKMGVNIFKIIICITTMMYVIDNYKNINVFKITQITSVLFAISIPMSILFYKSNILWRHNDIHNKYNLSRLNLFYLEPSELGFHVAILIIILLGYLLISNDIREKAVLFILIITNGIVLYMAKPMGAIVILAASIFFMLFMDLIYKPTKFKYKLYGLFVLVFGVIAVILIYQKSPIVMRIYDTINGTDSSNSYRIGVTLDVFKQSFLDYKGLGCGFGNLNTEQFRANYGYLGLVVGITNSFFYIAIEAGITGIIALFAFIIIMARKCLMDKSVLKWGLFIFLMLYQVFAGHFTSGLYWVLYGIILSGFNERDYNKNVI